MSIEILRRPSIVQRERPLLQTIGEQKSRIEGLNNVSDNAVKLGEAVVVFSSSDPIQSPTRKTPKMLEIETRFGEPIEVLLRRLYDQGMGIEDIGVFVGLGKPGNKTPALWMKKFGIPSRSRNDAMTIAMQDPMKRDRVKKGTINAISKRVASVKAYWRHLAPDEKEKRVEASSRKIRTDMMRKIKQKLGKKPYEKVKALQKKGETLTQIAEDANIPLATLHRWVKTWRLEIGESVKEVNEQLWSFLRRPAILKRTLQGDFLTNQEFAILQDYFEKNTGELDPEDEIFDKLSIAVANCA